jgi:tripartite-type tricarboxylate transporter receptor subunit TctC
MHRRSFCFGAAAVSAALPRIAFAQIWPARAVRMIVPFPAGGGTDAISRQLAERITNATSWSMAIENRAGAGAVSGPKRSPGPVVSVKSSYLTLGELIVAAKARPGTVAVAHTGNGTVGHLAGEVFARRPAARS